MDNPSERFIVLASKKSPTCQKIISSLQFLQGFFNISLIEIDSPQMLALCRKANITHVPAIILHNTLTNESKRFVGNDAAQLLNKAVQQVQHRKSLLEAQQAQQAQQIKKGGTPVDKVIDGEPSEDIDELSSIEATPNSRLNQSNPMQANRQTKRPMRPQQAARKELMERDVGPQNRPPNYDRVVPVTARDTARRTPVQMNPQMGQQQRPMERDEDIPDLTGLPGQPIDELELEDDGFERPMGMSPEDILGAQGSQTGREVRAKSEAIHNEALRLAKEREKSDQSYQRPQL